MALPPEIQTCLDLIDATKSYAGTYSGNSAVFVLGEAWVAIGEELTSTTLQEILAISAAPRSLLPMIKGKGGQAVGLLAVNALDECFSITALRASIENWVSITAPHVATFKATLSIFEDLEFDGAKIVENAPEISEVLGGVKGRLVKLEGLSDASRTILMCQVDLIEKSLLRFQKHGVSAFRESVFSMYGRVSIELTAAKDEKVKGSLKETADDLLRVAGLVETASAAFQLVAPVALKMIAGPSS